MSIQSECPALKLIVPPHPTKKNIKKKQQNKNETQKTQNKTNKQTRTMKTFELNKLSKCQ